MLFVLPYINYCCEIWGITCKGTIEPLIILQKKAIRIVSKVGKYDHTNNLFNKLKLLKFVDLIDLKVGLIMFKARLNKLPKNVQEKFSVKVDIKYGLRNSHKFKVNFVRTSLKARTISVYGVKIFYKLSNEIIGAKNELRFKALFKQSLLNKYN